VARALGFLVLVVLAVSSGARAQSQEHLDIFTITGVVIDAKGESATEARQTAIAEGSAKALRKLFERLTLEEDHALLPGASPGLATSMATGFQIDNELRSPTRYRGLLTVSFDPDATSQYLRRNEVDFVEAAAPPTLVLPVLHAGGRARLWRSNPWADVWTEDRYAATFTPIVTPDGFESDEELLDVDQALEPDLDAVRALARVYEVERVLLAEVRLADGDIRVDLAHVRTEPEFSEIEDQLISEPLGDEDPGTGRPDADMDAAPAEDGPYAFGDEFEPVVTDLGSVRVQRSESDDVLQLAADRAQARLAEEWKKSAVVRAKQRTQVTLTVLYRDIKEWADLQTAIGASPFVADARLDGVSRDGALMTVTYRGAREQLLGDLFRRGARLQSHPDMGEVIHSALWRPFRGAAIEEPADAPAEPTGGG